MLRNNAGESSMTPSAVQSFLPGATVPDNKKIPDKKQRLCFSSTSGDVILPSPLLPCSLKEIKMLRNNAGESSMTPSAVQSFLPGATVPDNKTIPDKKQHLCFFSTSGDVILPSPFNLLKTVRHSKAKGRAMLVCILNDWKIAAYKCEPFVRIVDDESYNKCSDVFFLQCPNTTQTKVGFLCLAMHTEQKTKKRIKKSSFARLPDGIVPSGSFFLCLSQGFYFDTESCEMMAVLHRMVIPASGKNFCQTMDDFKNDTRGFALHVFDNKPTIVKARSIDLVYLNQVAGPSMEKWEIKRAVSLEYKVPFIESRKQPDAWCDQYLSSESSLLFKEIILPQSSWRSGCELLPKQNRKKMKTKASIGFQRMQRRSKEPTDIFICSPRPPICNGTKGRFILTEYLTNQSMFVVAAPLTVAQCIYLNGVIKEDVLITEYNSLIDHLLKQSGQRKRMLFCQKINSTTSPCFIVSLLAKNKSPCEVAGATKVTSNIWKYTIPKNTWGALDVEHGFPIQHCYSWPFEKIMNVECHKFVEATLPTNTGTTRNGVYNRGLYQGVGERATTQANGSIMTSYLNVKEHHHYHSFMNKSMLPFLISKKNQFRHEAMQAGFHCGEIFCTTLKHVSKDRNQYNLMKNSLLTTRNFYNSLHFDHDFMTDFESNAVEQQLKKCGIFQCLRFIENYKSSFPHIHKLPMQTTCCWCLVERNKIYTHRQFFANVTCGTALDISSTAFTDTVPQIGSTFYGGCFQHCTMKGLWVRNDGYVRLKPPNGSRNYNFAWGDHVENRREKARRANAKRKYNLR